jgi:NhaP-type Na+/H+ or K+/H+ antiporter
LIVGIRDYSIFDLAISATVVSAVVIIARFAWMYPATYLPRWLIPAVRRKDPSPPWQWPTALAFTGVRGIVSLAAALGIPFTTDSGEPFPQRDLILFLTFSVILVTLVGQGLMLPTVIRWLGLAHAGRRERHADREEEFAARRHAIEVAIERLGQLASERQLSDDIVRPLRAHYRDRLKNVEHQGDGDRGRRKLAELNDEIEFQLIEAERLAINDRYRRGQLKDEARRRVERELDLRDARLTNLRAKE